MLTCTDGRISLGMPSWASGAMPMRTISSSSTPSWICTLCARSAATVVSQRNSCAQRACSRGRETGVWRREATGHGGRSGIAHAHRRRESPESQPTGAVVGHEERVTAECWHHPQDNRVIRIDAPRPHHFGQLWDGPFSRLLARLAPVDPPSAGQRQRLGLSLPTRGLLWVFSGEWRVRRAPPNGCFSKSFHYTE
jgi:hypothetical protein